MTATRIRTSGFTLIEALLAVAVIGILGGLTFVNITGARNATASSKLDSDVRVINNAIDTYLAAGGAIPANATADQVLALLKTRANAASSAQTLGMTGSFLDRRTRSIWQTSAEAASSAPRAHFLASPQPRFIVASAGGVGIREFAFDEVAASAAPMTEGRTPAIDQATQTAWVWDYTDNAPAVAAAGQTPDRDDSGNPPLPGGTAVNQLLEPVLTPEADAYPLLSYPIDVSIGNPNPGGSSRIYYSIDGGSYMLYITPFPVDPGTQVQAVALTLDPSRYANSEIVSGTYTAVLLQLAIEFNAPSTITYAEAGGVFANLPAQTAASATVNLLSSFPSKYLTNSNGIPNFNILYTTDGSDPLEGGIQGPAFGGTFVSPSISLAVANWGTNTALPLRAVAVSQNPAIFETSPEATANVEISRTPLNSPSVSPSNQVVTFSVTVTMSVPTFGPSNGMIINYTTNDTAPTSGSPPVYNSPFPLSSFSAGEAKTVRAVTMPVPNLANWFDPSPETVRVYTGPSMAGSGIPDGALAGSANLNSTFNGNVTIAYPTNGAVANITYNQNAVINGSLYVPGTPNVAQNSPWIPQWFPTNDHQFANRIYGIVEGMEVSPRVVDLDGPVSPTNYTITFNNNSYITGKIFRRAERYTLTPLNLTNYPVKTSSGSLSLNGPVSEPLNPANVANVTLNTTQVGSVTLLPGTYGNMTANNDTKFVLGDPGGELMVYSFDSLQLNSEADLVIVGPVILNIRNGFQINNGSVLGNEEHPEWLQINVWNGDVSANSGSSIYGRLYVPNHTVSLNNGSVLVGSVSAKVLNLNSAAVVFSLSPANSPGL